MKAPACSSETSLVTVSAVGEEKEENSGDVPNAAPSVLRMIRRSGRTRVKRGERRRSTSSPSRPQRSGSRSTIRFVASRQSSVVSRSAVARMKSLRPVILPTV